MTDEQKTLGEQVVFLFCHKHCDDPDEYYGEVNALADRVDHAMAEKDAEIERLRSLVSFIKSETDICGVNASDYAHFHDILTTHSQMFASRHTEITTLKADNVYLKNIQADLVEQRDALHAKVAELEEAGKNLYAAGHWELEEAVTDPHLLWESLRDALQLPPGTAPQAQQQEADA